MDLPVVTARGADVIALARRLKPTAIACSTGARSTAYDIDWFGRSYTDASFTNRSAEGATDHSAKIQLIPMLASGDLDNKWLISLFHMNPPMFEGNFR